MSEINDLIIKNKYEKCLNYVNKKFKKYLFSNDLICSYNYLKIRLNNQSNIESVFLLFLCLKIKEYSFIKKIIKKLNKHDLLDKNSLIDFNDQNIEDIIVENKIKLILKHHTENIEFIFIQNNNGENIERIYLSKF